MPRRIPLEPGEKRGRLTVIAEVDLRRLPSGQTVRRVRCRCDCGAEIETDLRKWRDGHTTSCGCRAAEVAREVHTTHGQAGRGRETALWHAWRAMRDRCSTGYADRYPTYAGVKCDERWSTFEGFRDNQPAGRKFKQGLVLARTGDVGDYSPENCRWATKAENAIESIDGRRGGAGRFATR